MCSRTVGKCGIPCCSGVVACISPYPPDLRLSGLVALSGAHINLRNKSVRSSARYHRTYDTPAQRSTHIRVRVVSTRWGRSCRAGRELWKKRRPDNGRCENDGRSARQIIVKKIFPHGAFFRNIFFCRCVWIHLSSFLERMIGPIETPMMHLSLLTQGRQCLQAMNGRLQ